MLKIMLMNMPTTVYGDLVGLLYDVHICQGHAIENTLFST